MTIALVFAFIPAPFENPGGVIAWRSYEKPELAMADAADFRRIALSFEGAGEYPHFDRRAFKARVTFATLAPDELSANIKFAPDEQALKCAVAPDAFAALDNAWGSRGWTRATLAALSEAELKAALEMTWRHAAPNAKARARKRSGEGSRS
jgi:hypothetical protein